MTIWGYQTDAHEWHNCSKCGTQYFGHAADWCSTCKESESVDINLLRVKVTPEQKSQFVENMANLRSMGIDPVDEGIDPGKQIRRADINHNKGESKMTTKTRNEKVEIEYNKNTAIIKGHHASVKKWWREILKSSSYSSTKYCLFGKVGGHWKLTPIDASCVVSKDAFEAVIDYGMSL